MSGIRTRAVTARAVTARAVTARAVTARAVTARAVTARARRTTSAGARWYSRLGRIAGVIAGSVLLHGCGRTVSTPPATRRPEPVAPMMMPAAVADAPPSLRETVQQLGDSAIGAPMWRHARWGMLVVDVTSGDTLLSRDAGRLFMPASNQKLLTAAVSMQTLGPDYRWRTPVLLRGQQRGDTWIGDVLVAGSGDPSISDALRDGHAMSAFEPVVTALRARGIRRVRGDVLPIGDAFSGPPLGYGWEVDDFDSPYGAAVDELMFNEGLLTLRVYGGSKVGAPVRVVRAPTATFPTLNVRAETRAVVDRRERIRAAYDSVGVTVEITGAIAVGDSAILSLAYRHPGDAFRAALREHIAASAVTLAPRLRERSRTRGRTRGRTTADSAKEFAVDTLVVLQSLPLRDVLPRMQKPSQNQIAELLFRTNGLQVSGDGSADSARAVGARTLASFGVAPDDIAYRDGSGLSRHDYLTPRAVVQVLDAMRRSPWFEVYRNALPLAGVDGTIANRMKGTAAAGNAQAKTGTVDKARALSGYVTTADGHLVLFSLLCNNYTVANREVERVQDLLVTTIAASRAGSVGVARER